MVRIHTEERIPVPVRRKRRADPAGRLILHEREGVVWCTAPNLDRESGWLTHGFSTRLGGVTPGETGPMNLGFTRPDEKENVRENFRRMAAVLGLDTGKLVIPLQTHTTSVHVATARDAGKGFSRERDFGETDALVTDVPGLTLVCYGADCVTLLAADPRRKAVGCAHSGWRGTVGDIGGGLIRAMEENYGCDPRDILTVIGPSICADCYEVGEELAESFAKRFPQEMMDRFFTRNGRGRFQLDLWQACAANFEQAGVLPGHICVTDLCTRCNPELLFSFRAQKGRQGSLAALISIR